MWPGTQYEVIGEPYQKKYSSRFYYVLYGVEKVSKTGHIAPKQAISSVAVSFNG